jgi:hypothetical protein
VIVPAYQSQLRRTPLTTLFQATSGASKEANKNIAKDSNVDLSTRATAAKDAVGDKMDESKHSVRDLTVDLDTATANADYYSAGIGRGQQAEDHPLDSRQVQTTIITVL